MVQAALGQPAPLTRRRFALLALAANCGFARGAAAATLPAPESLAAELAQALRLGMPLVVMASLDGCPFCKWVRDSHLAPLRMETGQPVVQLDMRRGESVIGFDGMRRSHDEVLRSWRVQAAPTVLFFGRGSREVAPRLAGASIPDFYGAYLDERLRAARGNLT
jgi:hypothetical protein